MSEKTLEIIELHLDGRDFISAGQAMTAWQTDYVTAQLNDAGASEILFEIARGNTTQDAAKRLFAAIARSGLQSKLVAGLLKEKDKKWTWAEAERNADIFREITDAEEQARMRTSLISLVLAFFPLGEASSTTSPKSLNPSEKAPGISNEDPAISENTPELSAK